MVVTTWNEYERSIFLSLYDGIAYLQVMNPKTYQRANREFSREWDDVKRRCLRMASMDASDSLKRLKPNADACLFKFISLMSPLFGEESMTYNVHILSHIPEYVEKYGPLESFSAFQFENYLFQIKRRIRPSRFLFETSLTQMNNLRHILGTSIDTPVKFDSQFPNNCCQDMEGKIIFINYFDSSNHSVNGLEMALHENLYQFPYPSSALGIGLYKKTNNCLLHRKIVRKCLIFPTDDDSFAVFPMCC